MSQTAAVARPARGGRETGVLVFAVAATVAAGIPLLRTGSYALVGLLGVAFALGWIFLTAEFGYTAGFRRLVAARDGSSLAPGLLVAAVAALVIVPVAALVHGYSGYVAPIGLPLVGGAALFGLGMQLANGCASGTLYAAGGGSRRLWFTLPFFCLGGVLGSLILPAALRLPALPPVVLSQLFGPWTGLLVTLAMTGALTVVMLRHGQRPSAEKLRAAVLIGVLAAVAFLLSRQPWGVTMGLTVWGAKVVNALGFDLTHTQFWSGGAARQALEGSILRQDSSLMNIGMLLGAMAASAWQGGFRAKPWPPARGLVAAALGGLTMGIGARLAFGCNIGALVGGISSGSLHGFVWFAAALPGTWLGLKLRPVFGLSAT